MWGGAHSAWGQGWTNASLTDGGKYYLQSVGASKWWGVGNDWGTRASLVDHPDFVVLHAKDGGYTLESQVRNNNDDRNVYFNGDYMDNNSPVTLTIQSNGSGLYSIANGSTYYGYDGTSTVLGKAADRTTNNGLWRIFSDSEMKTNLGNATIEAPVDATFLITDPNFGRNNRYASAWSTWSQTADNKTKLNISGGNNTNNCAESFHAKFYCKQTLTDVPNGVYAMTAQGFWRQDGSDNTNLPYFYINSETRNFPQKTGSENSMTDASVSFTNGTYTIEPIYVEVTNGTIELGAKNDENLNLWCIWDNFVLSYYGNVTLNEVKLYEFVKLYNAAMDEAKSYQSVDMFDADKTALNTAISTNTLDLGTATEEGLTEATANLKAAVEAAKTAVTYYTNYNAAVTKINGGTNVDLTEFIVNPSFETGTTAGWTNVGMTTQGNTSFTNKDGATYAESWQPNGTKSLSQTVGALPAGLYELSVIAKARGVTSAKVFAAGVEQSVKIADEENTYTVSFALDDKTTALIGFEGVGTGAGSSWLALDNFKLKYVGALPELTAVVGQMNASVASAQASAIDDYNTSKTAANYNAAVQAINNAQASKDAYANAASAIAAANTLKENHNFASASAIETFAGAIAAIKNDYDDGKLKDADANAAGTKLGVVVTGWRSNANSASAKYMNDGFSLKDFDGALYVNQWSAEGEADGSNFVVPFYENYAGDTESLAANTFSGTLSGLDNGLYKVSLWVRARVKNDVDLAEATGVTIDVNDGDAVSVTTGTQVGDSRFKLATFEAEGLVKDGNLRFNVKVLAGTNISWLSFKNVKYTKVRDLTPEEAAVKPTAIVFDKTTAELYIGKTLTLTPTFTPDDATTNATWKSSDETVATVTNEGVVTALKYGTATITMTSTIDTEVSASCEITVTAPLITAAENLDFAEGPVIDNHICTYAADMTKSENNTTYSRTQPVTGWTIVSTDADGKAAGIMTYGSSTGMGNNSIFAPATNPEGDATGNVFGMVGVWTGNVQYVQNVKMPAGAYTITLPIYRNGGDGALTANLIGVILDDGTEHLATAKTYAADTWTTETIKFTVTEETYGRLSLGLTNPNVGTGGSQRLWIDRVTIDFEPFATEAEIAALNTAVENAEKYTLGFEKNEYAPYNNVEALTALAAAKALDTENPIGQSDVTGATAALTAATWTVNAAEVNAVFDGSFEYDYRSATPTGNINPIGWRQSSTSGENATNVRYMDSGAGLTATTSGKALFAKFFSYYGYVDGYQMPLKANTVYSISFVYGGWGDCKKDGYVIMLDPDGASLTLSARELPLDATNGDADPAAWKSYTAIFKTGDAGNYVLGFGRTQNTQSQYVFGDIVLKKAVPEALTISETADYVPAMKYADVTFKRTLVDGWNGLVLPFDLTADEVKTKFNATKVKAFDGITFDADNGVTLQFADADELKAGQPFLVKAAAGTTYTFDGVLLSADALHDVTQSDGTAEYTMKGTYAGTTDLLNVDFALIQGTQYFYHTAGVNNSTAKAFRAYFENSSIDPAAARVAFDLDDDQTTAISDATRQNSTDGKVYDLQGRRVVKAGKGLYIRDGKKVVVGRDIR